MSSERDQASSAAARRRGELEAVEASYVAVESAPPVRTLDVGGPGPAEWSWGTALWVGALVGALGWVAWSDVLELWLHGWDTFPLIAASRVERASDVVRLLSEELMGGRFPGGRYWRPLVHSSFALDHALGGLDPRAYHRTDLAATLAGGIATSWLALALLGADRRLWAALAGFLFVLHPAHFELTPLAPRRADSLALAFTLLALLCVARARWRTSFAAAGFAFLAAASKETGALCAVLAPALASTYARGSSWRERLAAGVRASWPTLAALASYLALRTAVLGGLGGGAKASVGGAASDLGRAVARYAQLVLAPAPPADWASGGALLAFGVAALVVLAWTLSRARPREEAGSELEPRALCGWLMLWLLSLAALTAMSGVFRAWYAAPFVAPVALLAASAAATRAQALSRRFLPLAAVVVLALLQGWSGDGAQRWAEIRASSDAARELVARFDGLVAGATPGSVVELDGAPPPEGATRHGVATRRPATLREYSLAAYAELAHPGRNLRVLVKRGEAPAAAPDEVVVLLVARVGQDAE